MQTPSFELPPDFTLPLHRYRLLRHPSSPSPAADRPAVARRGRTPARRAVGRALAARARAVGRGARQPGMCVNDAPLACGLPCQDNSKSQCIGRVWFCPVRTPSQCIRNMPAYVFRQIIRLFFSEYHPHAQSSNLERERQCYSLEAVKMRKTASSHPPHFSYAMLSFGLHLTTHLTTHTTPHF